MPIKPVNIIGPIQSTFREFPPIFGSDLEKHLLKTSGQTVGATLSLPHIGGIKNLQDVEEINQSLEIFKWLMKNPLFKKTFEHKSIACCDEVVIIILGVPTSIPFERYLAAMASLRQVSPSVAPY